MRPDSTSNYCGVFLDEDPKHLKPLPLESVQVHVLIVDVSARVTISQVYCNPDGDLKSEATYVFPVPVRAAVCGFEMRSGGGRVVKGVVKETAEAQSEYQEAIDAGVWAGLLKQTTQDVFTVSLGAIPPKHNVFINISYVIDLSDDELQNQVRFQLPFYVGARYGTPCNTLPTVVSSSTQARVKISTEIEMASPVSRVTSPSHVIKCSSGRHVAESTGAPHSHFATVKLESSAFLDKDFLLCIEAETLDAPRCFSEFLDSSQGCSSTVARTVALSLTLVPRIDISDVQKQEFVFVIDRSGSMSGTRIDVAKNALIVLLRSLPSTEAYFNIYSFGSRHSSLWNTSQVYDQGTLDEASRHIDSMQADMGRTEIQEVLGNIFASRTGTVPTSVFLLTDGKVNNLDATLTTVRTAVSSSSPSAYLRIFTLGIGDGASTALVEGIARVGNGACLMALNNESIVGKCARLIKASKSHPLSNIRVDWGVKTDGTSRLGVDVVQQGPAIIPDILPGVRIVVQAILAVPTPPTYVTLKATRPTGDRIEVPIRVQPLLQFQSIITYRDQRGGSSLTPLIHCLAARKLIQDLEDGENAEATDRRNDVDTNIVKTVICRLAVKYQLTTMHTSFIAVDESTDSSTSLDNHSYDPGNFYDGKGKWTGVQSTAESPLQPDGSPTKSCNPEFPPPPLPPKSPSYARARLPTESTKTDLFPTPSGSSLSKTHQAHRDRKIVQFLVNESERKQDTHNPSRTVTSSSKNWPKPLKFLLQLKGRNSAYSRPTIRAQRPIMHELEAVKLNTVISSEISAGDTKSSPNFGQRCTHKGPRTRCCFYPHDSGGEIANERPSSKMRAPWVPHTKESEQLKLESILKTDKSLPSVPVRIGNQLNGERCLPLNHSADGNPTDQIPGGITAYKIRSRLVDLLVDIDKSPFLDSNVPMEFGHDATSKFMSINKIRQRLACLIYDINAHDMSSDSCICGAAPSSLVSVDNICARLGTIMSHIENSVAETTGPQPPTPSRPVLYIKAQTQPPHTTTNHIQSSMSSTSHTSANTTIYKIARLQAYNGLCPMDETVATVIGKDLPTVRSLMPASITSHSRGEEVWATVLIAAYLQSNLSAEKEVWEAMYKKAAEFVTSVGLNFEELLREAQACL